MSELGHKFLAATLGPDGAKALRKAVEREPQLAGVLIPRTIVSWLSFVTEESYEGQIPGIENSYVQFQKSESDGFRGNIALEQGLYSFEGSSVYHLAAGIATALGLEPSTVDPRVRDTILVKLGKSIDTLARARVLVKSLKTETALKPQRLTTHGEYHIEKSAGPKPYSVVHTKSGKVVQPDIATLTDAQPIATWHQKKAKDLDKVEAPGQTHQPTAQQGPQAPIPPQKQPQLSAAKKQKIPSMSIGKSEAARACSMCGGKQFEGHRFKGCFCYADLAKSITTTAYGDGYVLTFKSSVDADAVRALMRSFRSSADA